MAEILFLSTYLGMLSTVAVLTVLLMRQSANTANVVINVNNPLVLGDDDSIVVSDGDDDDYASETTVEDDEEEEEEEDDGTKTTDEKKDK